MYDKKPIKFVPYLKSVIWGGNKICRYKGIVQSVPDIGESWEVSAVAGCESIVSQGRHEGMGLRDLISLYGAEVIGRNIYEKMEGEFPLLVKFIDANADLSIQVHPGEHLARERHGCMGKDEMWYIIETEKGAKIYSGLREALSPETYRRRITDNSFMDALAVHESHPDDIFFIPSGRVHAIGKGNLLVEIQQSSDITYRIYDYGRVDKDGRPRELHTEAASDAIDYNVYDTYRVANRSEGRGMTELVRSDYFTTSKINLDGKIILPLDSSLFTIVVCLRGEARIFTEDPATENCLKSGETLLIPSSIKGIILEGKGEFLATHP